MIPDNCDMVVYTLDDKTASVKDCMSACQNDKNCSSFAFAEDPTKFNYFNNKKCAGFKNPMTSGRYYPQLWNLEGPFTQPSDASVSPMMQPDGTQVLAGNLVDEDMYSYDPSINLCTKESDGIYTADQCIGKIQKMPDPTCDSRNTNRIGSNYCNSINYPNAETLLII